MSQYRRGVALERELIALLKSGGYSIVRGAGSKGDVAVPGGVVKADIVATKQSPRNKKTVYLVLLQAKLTKQNKETENE